MERSYLDYAMSVIVSRALPDVRDGLKPVQRRILHAMHDMGIRPGSQYKKSARIVEEMLADIDRNTVNFVPHFDDSLTEPVPLPARLPNLLANGASGIAVGMATTIPPHNLSELCDAIVLLIENPDASTEDLAEIVKGPDFPTGGVIFRYETVRQPATNGQGPTTEKRDAFRTAYADGRGRVVMRARVHIEEMAKGNRHQIIVNELPYQTNKAALIEQMDDPAP